MNFGRWDQMNGKVAVRYGIHESREPLVVLEVTDVETGASINVALTHEHLGILVVQMATALERARAEVQKASDGAVLS